MSYEIIIIDLDKTIADNYHRTKYTEKGKLDWDILLDPKLIKHDTLMYDDIPKILKILSKTYYIVLLSGRVSKQRNETLKWLSKYDIYFDDIMMRKRNESYIKYAEFKEMKIKEMNEKYEIVLGIDDDETVIDIYDKYEIQCFHIEDGYDWIEISKKLGV